MFQKYVDDSTKLREQLTPRPLEIDYHYESNEPDGLAYHERMDRTYQEAMATLKQAQQNGVAYMMFRHGWSTSRRGATTPRSQIRKLMRSKEATRYIIRKNCIQHSSVCGGD